MDLYIPDVIPKDKTREDIVKEAEESPTYLAAYSQAHTGLANPGTYATNTQIAANHFQWLEANLDKEKLYSTGEKRWLLVAVFYDPENQVYFASTVPRGLRRDEMIESGSAKAPAWWYLASQKHRNSHPPLHAEDSAYFSYESTVEYSFPEDTYPDGSFIAAFGAQRDQALNNYLQGGPKPIALCAGSSSMGSGKKPSCRAVAQGLGVGFGTQGSVAPGAATVGDEDYDDGLTVEDWMEIDCKTLSSPQRRSIAMNGGHMMIGKRNITCPSPVELSLDYENYPTPTSLSTPVATWSSAGSYSSSAPMTITTTTSVTPSTLSTSVVSSVSCYAHFDDPDAGDNNQYCVCNTSRTESFLPSGPLYPCSYSTLPPRKRDNLRTPTPSDAIIITATQTTASGDVPVATSIAVY
ncbi:hypothetical protein F5Y01DRAFT_298491 [Xylaria sp. FL0043]|nr:hypothetical protein F5Y01DRAFT_298491 [Xylaria sp. FL0043]